MVSNLDILNKFCIVFKQMVVKDLGGNNPEVVIQAANRLTSDAAGKRTKFTINMYNTQCSLLINGNNTPTFQDEILPDIIEKITSNPQMSTLDNSMPILLTDVSRKA